MAFGIKADELREWKHQVASGKIAFLTHFWLHPHYPHITTVTKVGCANLERLIEWGNAHGLQKRYIHMRADFPHYDLIGSRQQQVLYKEKLWSQIERFNIPIHSQAK